MTELTLGINNAPIVHDTGHEPYWIENDAGQVTDHPIHRLPVSDQALTRDFTGTVAFQESPSFVERFIGSTGTAEDKTGKPYVKVFQGLGTLVGLKKTIPVRGASLYSFEKDESGNATGKPLGFRQYTMLPTTNLHEAEVLEQYNKDGHMQFDAFALAELYKVSKAKVKASQRYDVDRLPEKNKVLVDFDLDSDGTPTPVRVFATYFLRVKFTDSKSKVMRTNRNTGKDYVDNAQLYVSVQPRNIYDVTDEFLEIWNVTEGKNADERVRNTLRAAFVSKDTKYLQKCLELQARSAVAAMVSGIADYRLQNRMRMYWVIGRDAYYGLESSFEKNEFCDYHMRLSAIEDPMGHNMGMLANTRRLNEGTNLVM